MLCAILRVQKRLQAAGKLPAYDLAATCRLLGARQHALNFLQVSIESHEAPVIASRVDRDFQSLHWDPFIQRLGAQVGLPPSPELLNRLFSRCSPGAPPLLSPALASQTG